MAMCVGRFLLVCKQYDIDPTCMVNLDGMYAGAHCLTDFLVSETIVIHKIELKKLRAMAAWLEAKFCADGTRSCIRPAYHYLDSMEL